MAGTAAGIAQGATGISAPIIATYFHTLRLDPKAYVFCVTAAFQTFGVMQTAALYHLGLFTQARLVEGVWALIPAFIGLPLGMKLHKHISVPTFNRIMLAMLGLMEIRLLYDGLVGP